MPLYRFRCEKCRAEFEEIKPFAQSDFADCPDCGGAARKLVSRFAVSGDSSPGSGFCSPHLGGG